MKKSARTAQGQPREILFRGRGMESRVWHTGYYLRQEDVTHCPTANTAMYPDNVKHYIAFDKRGDWGLPNKHSAARVDPSTVGQYIGMRDKTGRRIFEGDILNLDNFKQPICEVRFVEGAFCLVSQDCPFAVDIHYIQHGGKPSATVIGNIHDNPELLRI